MVFARTYTYSFDEFKNRELIKEMNKLDNMLNNLKKNRGLYMKLVCIVSMMLISGYISPDLCGTATYAADVNEAIAKINGLGEQILDLVRTIGYWTIIIITSKDCIKEALNGDKKGVSGAITKGVMIMATIYFLPELFDMMKSIIESDSMPK